MKPRVTGPSEGEFSLDDEREKQTLRQQAFFVSRTVAKMDIWHPLNPDHRWLGDVAILERHPTDRAAMVHLASTDRIDGSRA